jgi:hypothetical protein
MDPLNDKHKELLDLLQKKGINTDINKRWEEGVPHHPKSEELMDQVVDLDWLLMDDHFCWKVGGDGDNGENMMYLFDIIFDLQDKLAAESVPKHMYEANQNWHYLWDSESGPSVSDPFVFFVPKSYWEEHWDTQETIQEDVDRENIFIPHGLVEIMPTGYAPYGDWKPAYFEYVLHKWGFSKAPENSND